MAAWGRMMNTGSSAETEAGGARMCKDWLPPAVPKHLTGAGEGWPSPPGMRHLEKQQGNSQTLPQLPWQLWARELEMCLCGDVRNALSPLPCALAIEAASHPHPSIWPPALPKQAKGSTRA